MGHYAEIATGHYSSIVAHCSIWLQWAGDFRKITTHESNCRNNQHFIILFCVGFAWSFVFFYSPPQRPMTSDFLLSTEGFSIPDFVQYIFFPISILEKEPVFSLFECSVLNEGTTGTIFITYLVWRGPWLGSEPGTSNTRSQHYTTRLSRRRWNN